MTSLCDTSVYNKTLHSSEASLLNTQYLNLINFYFKYYTYYILLAQKVLMHVVKYHMYYIYNQRNSSKLVKNKKLDAYSSKNKYIF